MKKIKTKESRKLLFLDIGMVIACIIYMNIIQKKLGLTETVSIGKLFFKIIETAIKYIAIVKTVNGFISVVMFLLGLVAIVIIFVAILSFPLNVICLAIRNVYKNNLRERTTFKETTGLEYYRENFKDVTPATISILTDLNVEYDKDVTATVMKLYLNKNIDFQDNEIVILNLDTNNLKQSEVSLLNKLAERGNKKIFDVLERKQWSDLCLKEAQEEGYIVNKRSKKRFIIKLIILILIFIVCNNLFDTNSNLPEEETDELLSWYEEGQSEEEILNNPQMLRYMTETLQMVAECIAGLLTFVLPIYIIVYVIFYKRKKVKFVRTKKGKILVEQIYGMKNFIHDFSNLDEATKEQVILWDYFLIYAIVLEENSKIVDEICKYKKVTIPTIM